VLSQPSGRLEYCHLTKRNEREFMFFVKIHKIIKFYIIYFKYKTIKSRKIEDSTIRNLEEIQLMFQNNANDSLLQQVVRDLRGQIKLMEDVKVEGIRIKARVRWMEKNNCTPKKFSKELVNEMKAKL
jgi:hypothetical protein